MGWRHGGGGGGGGGPASAHITSCSTHMHDIPSMHFARTN